MKWEYKVLQVEDDLVSNHIDELQQNLNKHGAEGWELAAILHQHSAGGWTSQIATDLAIFKRGIEV